MKLGALDISTVKLGANQVQAVYQGNNLVWQNAPVAIAATGVGQTSFTANWNAYSGATYYLLDVSESSDFSTFVYENQITTSTSYVVIGLESNTTYYYRVRANVGYDSDAQAFFDRVTTAGGSLSTTEQDAVNTLVIDMKDDGIWAKMKAIYPMVGASAAACAQNLKSSSFTGTFSSGWTFASTGATPTNAYMDTNLNLNTMNSIDDISVGMYSRTNVQDSGSFGCAYPTAVNLQYFPKYTNTQSYAYLMDANNDSQVYTDSFGFYAMSRIASTIKYQQKNSAIVTWTGSSSGSLISQNFLFARGSLGFDTREMAFGFVGDGISSTNLSNFYTAVQGFNTTLDRYVGAPWYDNGELLLDAYPDSAAAYSLRKLRNNYIGGPIRVRRSSDNEEQDIYFDADGELDITQLTTFCGAGDGFVKTWYDQSGNGYDAEQSTAASQPQIVNSGTYLGYLDINNRLLTTSMPYTNGVDYSAFKVIKQKGGAVIGATVNTGSVFYAVSDTSGSSSFQNFTSVSYYKNNSLISGTARNSIYNVILNNYVTLTSFVTSQNTQNMTIGYPSYSNFELKEQIIYSNNQLSNINGINTNINAEYQIYWDGSQTSLLDSYGGSAAAYSLRALSSAYVGPLVRVRRASDNAEQDIYANYDGTLNTSSLESFCSGTDGFVETWYDQSGNGYDATQSTAADQPQIVSSGSVLVDSQNKPQLAFTSRFLNVNNLLSFTQPFTPIVVAQASLIGNFEFIFDTDGGSRVTTFIFNDGKPAIFAGSTIIASNAQSIGQHLYFSIYNTPNSFLFLDSNQIISGNPGVSNLSNITLGRSGQGIGKASEFIFYGNNQSSNRTGIETNINDFYSIY